MPAQDRPADSGAMATRQDGRVLRRAPGQRRNARPTELGQRTAPRRTVLPGSPVGQGPRVAEQRADHQPMAVARSPAQSPPDRSQPAEGQLRQASTRRPAGWAACATEGREPEARQPRRRGPAIARRSPVLAPPHHQREVGLSPHHGGHRTVQGQAGPTRSVAEPDVFRTEQGGWAWKRSSAMFHVERRQQQRRAGIARTFV
jgi:hypothetical protein